MQNRIEFFSQGIVLRLNASGNSLVVELERNLFAFLASHRENGEKLKQYGE